MECEGLSSPSGGELAAAPGVLASRSARGQARGAKAAASRAHSKGMRHSRREGPGTTLRCALQTEIIRRFHRFTPMGADVRFHVVGGSDYLADIRPSHPMLRGVFAAWRELLTRGSTQRRNERLCTCGSLAGASGSGAAHGVRRLAFALGAGACCRPMCVGQAERARASPRRKGGGKPRALQGYAALPAGRPP